MIDRLKKNVDVVLAYSTQAQIILNSQSDFTIEEFEAEFLKNIEIGDRTIVQFILNRGTKKIEEQGKDNAK